MRFAAFSLTALIRVYQYALSPLSVPSCRFQPSCSCYAEEAIRRHGALAGGWLTLKRLVRCHPWGGAGYDPVPSRPRSRALHDVADGYERRLEVRSPSFGSRPD